MGIKKRFEELVIYPGDSIKTIQTAIIVHSGDFYDPLKKYSALIRTLLPEFQSPADIAWQPEWCTWGYNQNFKPEYILSKLDSLKSLGIKSIILDDGWSVNHGDWIPDPKKFPSGDDDFKKLITTAAPCYNPAHLHHDPYESYFNTPVLFQNICSNAKQYNPEMILEYCACGIPPNIFHLPYINLAVTSDPYVGQITNRIKMYKALMGDDSPVLEEYCGIPAGAVYQLVVGTGGVPGTFSTYLDDYHRKWLDIYQKYRLSKGQYMNLYDIGFDYPEAHAIKKDDTFYYAYYTHPWTQLESRRWYRFGIEFDTIPGKQKEFDFPPERWKGRVELRVLDVKKRYRIFDYGNNLDIGIIQGNNPFLDVSFVNFLLLEATPVR